MKIVAMFLLTAAVALPAWGAKLYRWVDAQGRVFYTDKPPPSEAREAEKLRLNTQPGEVPLPYQAREAAKNFPVTLFGGDCGESCEAARKLLDTRGVPFSFKDGYKAEVQEELKKLSGAMEVPVLQVGRTTLVRGYEPGQWNAALDAAGYPKSIPRRPAPPKNAPPPTAGGKPVPADGKPAAAAEAKPADNSAGGTRP